MKKYVFLLLTMLSFLSFAYLFSINNIALSASLGLPNNKNQPPKTDSYPNSIVLQGYTKYPSRTVGVFKVDNGQLIASYGISEGDDLTTPINRSGDKSIRYRITLIGKNGQIKKEVSATGQEQKKNPLDRWGSVPIEDGDVIAVYTLETDKSFWYDADGIIGDLPPEYLIHWRDPESPNLKGDLSRSTLYYTVSNNELERVRLENLSDVTITEGDSLEQYINDYFKTNYGQDISVKTELGSRRNESGTYSNVKVSTPDSRFNQVFQNVFKNGITVHVKPKPVVFDVTVPNNLKFNDHTLGIGNNQIKLQYNPTVIIEDTRKNSPGWTLSLSSKEDDNALAKNLIFKSNNEIKNISNESTVIWSGSGSLRIPLAEHLFVQVPNDRSFLAQDYETTLTWNLASTP
ncbi:hypothetical protein R4Y45_06805 [Holzapfeliella sp. He02]|uniref:WxL domain-containing protein n=1 Tax=Holzapfeliella saturejae TaxID=3082953 RepID=A0ABU8SHS5_9LACO